MYSQSPKGVIQHLEVHRQAALGLLPEGESVDLAIGLVINGGFNTDHHR